MLKLVKVTQRMESARLDEEMLAEVSRLVLREVLARTSPKQLRQ